MAGDPKGNYGTDNNTFHIPGVQSLNEYYLIYNPRSNVSQIYQKQVGFGPFRNSIPVGTYNVNTDNVVFFPNAPISNQDKVKIKSNKFFLFSQTQEVLKKAGVSDDKALILLTPRSSGTQPAPAPTPPGAQDAGGAPTAESASDSTNNPAGNSGTEFNVDPLKQIPKETFGTDTFDSYKYPLSTIDRGQDNIIFTQLKYVRTGVTQTENQISNSKSGYTKLSGMVMLPMPNDISETNSVGWGEDSLSNAAAMFMPKLTNAGVSVSTGNVPEAGSEFNRILKDLVGNGALGNRINQSAAVKIAAGVIGRFGINVNPEAYIARATSGAINPNMELLFNGPKLRQFAFQFKMTPRDDKEARQIRGILRFFKKGMSPRRAGASSEYSFYLGVPNVFKIKFMSGNTELNSIGKIKTCALVSFAANYTPDGFYAAYSDSSAGGSQPIAVTMQMAFTELTPVFSDEYANDVPGGDDAIDIGPSVFTADYDLKETPPPPPPTTSTSTGQQQGPAGGQGTPLENINKTRYTLRSDGQVQSSIGEIISLEEYRRRLKGP